MKSNLELKNLHIVTSQNMKNLILNKNFKEDDLNKIIAGLYFDKKFELSDTNNFNLNEISNLLRFYEEELKNSFNEDNERFNIFFKLYLLVIELITNLCIHFLVIKEKRDLIDSIFQTLKESQTMLKFVIPFEEDKLKTLNNIIGEHLYYFSHIKYIEIKNKNLDYIFEEYFMYCESMKDGFELSFSTDFGNNPDKEYPIEEMILINNISFLLLKMLYKLSYYKMEINYLDNTHFLNIKELFKKISFLHKNSIFETNKEFEQALLEEFKNSAKILKNKKNHNMWDEKIKLLKLNTDEYKELIDIISSSK